MANVRILAAEMGESRDRVFVVRDFLNVSCGKKKLTGAMFDPNVARRRGKGRVSGGFPSRPVRHQNTL